MKKRIISFVLVLTLFVSLFTVYSFATESNVQMTSETDQKYARAHLYHKNSFGDETDDYGATPGLYNAVNSFMTVETESNGNKYAKYEINDSNKNVYFQFAPSENYSISTDNLGYMIFEMDFNDLGNLLNTNKFLEIHSGTGSFSIFGRVSQTNIINISNDGTNNFVYFNNNKSDKIEIEKGKWTHIRCELSILSSSATTYGFRCYIGDEYFETTFKLGTPKIITYLRMGSTNTVNQIFGLDNIALYSADKNLASYKEISSIKGALVMKVGAENASKNGQQIELENVPMLINNEIYCPVDILERFADADCSLDYTVELDGIKYIHIDNIPKAFELEAKAYDMGLILVGDSDYFLDDDATYSELVETMKTFVFNIPTEDSLKEIVKNYTNNFDHPYILANADKFAELRLIYENGNNGLIKDAEELLLYNYIKSYVDSAANQLLNYSGATPTGTYSGLKSNKIPVNGNYEKYNNNGYDNGGRVSIPTTPLLYFAFAYQMTGHLNYARAAYDYTLALGDWNHWGPDHFLNCADTAAPVSISYDWLYDAYEELNSKGEMSKYSGKVYDKKEISTILFTHVIIPGYVQSNNLTCPWPGTANSRYATKTSNWNAVCVSGVVSAALVILEDEINVDGMTFETQKKIGSTFTQTTTKIDEIGNQSIHMGLNTYSDYAAKLTSMNLGTLAKYGLEQYAPDGSYVESPSYWSYGTNSFFRLIASLVSATGDDFGFMDAWGIDTTCYFAIHSESSDYNTWNFNDGGVGQQDSSFFFFVGDFYGDDELIKVRKKHLSSGKKFSIYDILFYDKSVTGEPDLETEYYMVGIDAFSVRSSWDKGAIYSGIIGGPNKVSHGQMDAGSFIYHNNGKIWFHDLGADNYNMAGGYFSNFKLYRVGAEGHNIIAITSEQTTLPYGQAESASPKIVKTVNSDEGGYAVLDMSDSYGSHVVKANRGILFTNSRSTVVIQDEYVFNGTKTAYWFGHYNTAPGYVDEVLISADGRTAFMISGEDMIRVSIVSENKDLKFEIMDAYTYVLNITKRTDKTTMGGATTEYNRDSIKKLAIKCENVETLNLAVVIESVDSIELDCTYEYTSIDNWTIKSDKSIIGEKFKADFQSDSYTIGSYTLESTDNSYVLKTYKYDSEHYLGILPNSVTSKGKDSTLKILLDKNTSINLGNHKYITADFDLFTENLFLNGALLGFKLKSSDGASSFVKIAEFKNNSLIIGKNTLSVSKSWKHITLVLDTKTSIAYLYANNDFVGKIKYVNDANGMSLQSFELMLPGSSAGDYYSSLLLDNINIRSFKNTYSSSKLDEILLSSSSLNGWNDALEYQEENHPLAMADGTYLYTNYDIEDAINSNKNITLLRDTTGIINVGRDVTIDTQGYRFDYVSDSYFPVVKGNFLSFESNSITVRWHIEDTVVTETYNGASIATFKGQSNRIGAISYSRTEYSQGGVGYKFYTTGWSNIPDGKALTQNEMVVSDDNCDFWLVNNVPVNCAFVTIDNNGTIVIYDSVQRLGELISSNVNLKIILCSDIEIPNTSSIPLSKFGKSLYLNGYSLSQRQYDIHTFTYQHNTTSDFNIIGPGTLEIYTSRAIFTSSSSTDDKTSPYGIVIENATIITDTMFADLRIGQHRFINCNFYQINQPSNIFLALWNKNSNANGNVPVNLLTVTFDGCNIKCTSPTTSKVFSYSANSYSEIYLKNTAVNANGALFEATHTGAKLHVTDGSSVATGKLYSESSIIYTKIFFDNGVTTNFTVNSKFMPENALLTNNFDDSLPYRVSNTYAHITWNDLNGNALYSEYVSVGVTPKITSPIVCDYLKSLGNMYTYELEEIESPALIVLNPVLKSSVKIFQSMTIEDDLSMYLYIEKNEMDNKVVSLKIDNIRIMSNSYKLVEMNGTSYYMYRISNFSPSNACREVIVSVEQKDGKTLKYAISVVNYLESLLTISDNEDEKILVVKLLKYIQSAYEYFNVSDISECSRISNLIDKYKQYDLVFGDFKNESATTGVMRDSIKSVCFNLSASIKIRFIINPSYTGEISVTFNGDTDVYYIKNGKVNGVDYIEVTIPSYMLNTYILLNNGINSLSYGLSTYSYAMNNSDPKLQNLLICMSEYSSSARRYINA